jgi:hypothetical protein
MRSKGKMPFLHGTIGVAMNEKICRDCVRNALDDRCMCEQDRVAHKKSFNRWFTKLVKDNKPYIPCFLNYEEDALIENDSPDQIEYYKCIQHWYLFHKTKMVPENCPYLVEHAVS